ncbi:MAG: hypothetical protein IPN20_25195 [Haliscomenobacter sp.]|nr:hypothetical protein [Haliscomenobacter sp.]
MINTIEIENIKGIQNKRFELNIIPNRPSLLVAPNGFGKSSIAIAFKSMNNRRIDLSEENFYSEDSSNLPKIQIEYTKPDNSIVNLNATESTNTISGEFDYFVINNNTKPKGNASTYGGFANARASLIIEDIVLVDRIPRNIGFGYTYRSCQQQFGKNSKVLPNVEFIFQNRKLVQHIGANQQALQKANGQRIKNKIKSVIDSINKQSGTTDEILTWISANLIDEFKQINYLNDIADLINEFDIGFNSEVKNYLAAIQLIWLYNRDNNKFKDACNFNNYKFDKDTFDETLSTFNCTWKNIRSTETGGKLVVKFPKAIHISNGQRDILSFISMLFRAKKSLRKDANILIIDEVFDYLDDANLTAAQYYITQLIQEYKDLNRRLYPLILTHLNPYYFNNFAFSKQKVYYLDKSTAQVNQHIQRLLRNRNDSTIENDVSKFLLHFHPNQINKRAEFSALGLPETWGEADNFLQFINSEIDKYINGQPYDPFAVCGALRIKIEETAYNKLGGQQAKEAFLNTNTTRKKLEKAEEMGIVSPESHYLLGIIYNEGMHWRDNQDNVSPIAAKLENLTIKKLITDIYE